MPDHDLEIERALQKQETEATCHWERTLVRSLRSLQREGWVTLRLDHNGEIAVQLTEKEV
jgi:hypothetical protein